MARDPASGRERARAYKLRTKEAKGESLSEEEKAWLDGYESRAAQAKARAATATERVSHVEERTMGVAEGGASIGDALVARQDGMRVDFLVESAVGSLTKACEMYHKMASDLLAQRVAESTAQMQLLALVREHYLGRIATEGELLAARSETTTEPDSIDQMVEAMFPLLMKRLEQSKKKKEPETP